MAVAELLEPSPPPDASEREQDPWLKQFLGRRKATRKKEFVFDLLDDAVSFHIGDALTSYVGGIYRILNESHMKYFSVKDEAAELKPEVDTQLDRIRQSLTRLKSDPEFIDELPMLSCSLPSLDRAYEVFEEEASGQRLDRRNRTAEDFKPNVLRSALIRCAGFYMHSDNKVLAAPNSPNFASRIETTPGDEWIMHLYWGRANTPHIFYGIDFKGENRPNGPMFTVADKLVVTHADRVARDFDFFGAHPRDDMRR